MNKDQIERYARHIVLKEVGGQGQAALLEARIAIVGAGGLGGPAGLYLAAAGAGHMTLIDDDAVDSSNLQRQVQFTHSDIGMGKARAMADTLADLNPGVSTKIYETRLTPDNAQGLLAGHDVVLDGTDSFEARFAVNAACLAQQIPLVSGALGRWNGQVAAFDCRRPAAPCYQCLVPDAPPNVQTCAAAGVIGALAGVVGSVMALETVKIITGAGEPLFGQLWLYDGLTARTRKVRLPKDPACRACGPNAA